MKKSYQLLLTLGITVASLSSCSRADYAFRANTSSYHQSTRVSASDLATAPVAEAVTADPTPVRMLPVSASAKALVEAPSVVTAPSRTQVGTTKTQVPSFSPQRLLVKKVVKQLTKATHAKQNAAEIAQPASKLGRAAIVTLVGLLLLVLGGAAEIGLIAIIGLIAFIVGIVLVITSLVNGE